MTIKFNVTRPRQIDPRAFRAAFLDASRKVAKEIHSDLDLTTNDFRHEVKFTEEVKETGNGIVISVKTDDLGYKYFDQGNGGPSRIIRPVRAKVLHFISKETGEDVFTKYVHGYNGRHVVQAVESKWTEQIPEYFDRALGATVKAL